MNLVVLFPGEEVPRHVTYDLVEGKISCFSVHFYPSSKIYLFWGQPKLTR